MFTGIIERTEKVQDVTVRGKLKVVRIHKPASWKLRKGQSINVNGVCSTVVRSSATSFVVEYMPETLRVTNVSSLKKGTLVNIERSLKYGDRMDGHVVLGHIEGVGQVREIQKEGSSRTMTLRLPAGLARCVIERGSIALDGVSLTVARRHGPSVTVALVPHTLSHTTLGERMVGDEVNVETDIVAKKRLRRLHATVGRNAAKSLRKTR